MNWILGILDIVFTLLEWAFWGVIIGALLSIICYIIVMTFKMVKDIFRR